MPLKIRNFNDEVESIFDEAIIFKRGDYWHMRMWLTNEKKYARFSLKTKNKSTALDKAKTHYHQLMSFELTGKRYFSITAKEGVERYLQKRKLEAGKKGGIVVGRYHTIRTHLSHWLDFIGPNTKLRELEKTDCEDYYMARNEAKSASIRTVANEQATINAMMKWLYSQKETNIEKFEFGKLPKVDRADENNRRNTFTDAEAERIVSVLKQQIAEAEQDLTDPNNVAKAVSAYYFGISLITGLRRGEQLQLRWSDIKNNFDFRKEGRMHELVQLVIRAETSKVRLSRKFIVKDTHLYFDGLSKLQLALQGKTKTLESQRLALLGNELLFYVAKDKELSTRAISYHFKKLLEQASINVSARNLVPYSFRHYFITKRVNSNLPAASIAEMCGTSIAQIEKTYYHTTLDKMISNALADYEYIDGMLVPK